MNYLPNFKEYCRQRDIAIKLVKKFESKELTEAEREIWINLDIRVKQVVQSL